MDGNEVRRNSPCIVGTFSRFCMYGSAQWLEYERRKADWRRENLGSTPAEYEAAIKRIAAECGV